MCFSHDCCAFTALIFFFCLATRSKHALTTDSHPQESWLKFVPSSLLSHSLASGGASSTTQKYSGKAFTGTRKDTLTKSATQYLGLLLIKATFV